MQQRATLYPRSLHLRNITGWTFARYCSRQIQLCTRGRIMRIITLKSWFSSVKRQSNPGNAWETEKELSHDVVERECYSCQSFPHSLHGVFFRWHLQGSCGSMADGGNIYFHPNNKHINVVVDECIVMLSKSYCKCLCHHLLTNIINNGTDKFCIMQKYSFFLYFS